MSMIGYVSVTEAATALGVNRRAVWRLISQGRLRAITNPLDHRAKLVRREDVEKLTQPGSGDEAERTPLYPWPVTVGAVDLDIRSDEVEEWLEANWRPT